MKILLFSHFFPPESGAAPVRINYFAKVMLKYQLNIIAPTPNYPQNKKIKNYEKKVPEKFRNKINYLPIILPKSNVHLTRALSYLSYMIISFFYSLIKFGDVKIVVSSSPPITTAFTAAFFAKLIKAKFILDIRDMWPQIGVELGILKNNFAIALLSKMENFILNSASKIIVTAEGDRQNLMQRNIPEELIEIIFNGADTEKFSPISYEEKSKIKEKYNIPSNKIILIYFGSFNYGMNDLGILSEVFANIEPIKEKLHFLAVGNGEQKEIFLQKLDGVVSYQSFNSVNTENLSGLIAASDLSLIPRKKIKQDTGGNIPVKCFESWSCGVPTVLSTIHGTEVEKLFERCGSGKLVVAGDTKAFSNAILGLIEENNLHELGLKGRKFVVDHFDRKKQAKKLIKIVEELEKS